MARPVRTACPHDCPDACSMIAWVEGDRVIRLTGDPDHPVTRGFLCPKTTRNDLERMYGPERILHPLRRRPDGTFQRVSWDEALDAIAAAIREALDRYGPLALFHYQGSGNLGATKMLHRRFFNLLGGCTYASSSLCGAAGIAGQTASYGYRTSHLWEDMVHSRLILLWGRNPADTGPHMLPFLREARARGAYVVALNPVPTRSERFVDRAFRVRPDGDGYLALAMAKVLLREGWVDWTFVERHSEGFEAYRALLDRYDLEELVRRSGLSRAEVEELARLYGTRKPAGIWLGWGMQRYRRGGETFRLIDALAALAGNVGVPGGGVSHGMDEWDPFDHGLLAEEGAVHRAIPKALLGPGLREAQDPPVQVAIFSAANPVSQSPGGPRVGEALRRIPTVVLLDLVWTDTAEYADWILPVAHYLEEPNLVASYGHAYLALARPAVPPPPEARPELEIFQELAARLGVRGMEGDLWTWLRRLLRPLTERHGITLERLEAGPIRLPDRPAVPFADRRFPTPSGRFRFPSDYPEVEDESEGGRYPFYLLGGHARPWLNGQPLPRHQRGLPEVYLAPEALEALGIRPGTRVRVASRWGAIEAVALPRPGQHPEVAHIYPGRQARATGQPLNALIPERLSFLGDNPTFYDVRVRVEKG